MSIILDNQTNTNIDLCLLQNIANSITTKDLELILTDAQYMQDLNNEHRQQNKSTDVLSFPLDNFNNTIPNMPLGSIVICTDIAHTKAKELEHTTIDEISLLFIHGLLHLMGYDHEIDNGEQRQIEEEIIKKFSLPKSLIVRTV